MKPLYKILEDPMRGADVVAVIERRRDTICAIRSDRVPLASLSPSILLDMIYIEKFGNYDNYPDDPSDDFGDYPLFQAEMAQALRSFGYDPDSDGFEMYQLDRQVQAVVRSLHRERELAEDERLAA